MKINKKLLAIIFLLIIIISFFIVKNDFEYSSLEMSALIDKSNEIPNNIYIKEETIGENLGMEIHEIYEIYVKDDIIYTKTVNSSYQTECIYNFKDKTEIYIHSSEEEKSIFVSSIHGNVKRNPLTEILIGFSRNLKCTQDKYKYLGKENFENKECIKFSLTDDDSQKVYYVDSKDNTVVCIKNYRELYGNITTTYTYSYGTVADDDILNFDISNYPDYEYTDLDINQ